MDRVGGPARGLRAARHGHGGGHGGHHPGGTATRPVAWAGGVVGHLVTAVYGRAGTGRRPGQAPPTSGGPTEAVAGVPGPGSLSLERRYEGRDDAPPRTAIGGGQDRRSPRRDCRGGGGSHPPVDRRTGEPRQVYARPLRKGSCLRVPDRHRDGPVERRDRQAQLGGGAARRGKVGVAVRNPEQAGPA
jgi:hypothetical protein